jgi:hypothetical protein
LNQILKIAGGVFLGILAAFAVYKAIDIWERQAADKSIAEDIRLEVKTERLRLTKAAENLSNLQPEKLEALCGIPLRDSEVVYRKPGQIGNRNISHMGADGHMVDMEFYCVASGCSFQGMHQADRTSNERGNPKNYETFFSTDGNLVDPHEKQIVELPCLIGLAEGWK